MDKKHINTLPKITIGAGLVCVLFFLGCKNKEEEKANTNERTYEVFKGEDDTDLHILSGDYTFKNEEARRLNSKGIELVKINELHKADGYFTKALELEPENPVVLCNIGNLYLDWGKDKLALDYYQEAWTKSDSSYFAAAQNLGIAYCNLQEYNKSEEVLNYLLLHSENDDEKTFASYVLVRVYLSEEKCSRANQLYSKIKPQLNKFPELKENQKVLEDRLQTCI